ncbi:MAG: Crp/Fnr family transcriptional regulator [Burkholderiaceae bacterium]|nr:Crp/Fnr family transcriptional regulator [Burkholderiaceae bacterium]
MSDLTEFERSRVEHEATEIRVQKGAYVFHCGETYPFWLGVAAGTLKSMKLSSVGKQVNFVYILEGTWFGEGTLINHEPRRYSLQAVEDTLLLRTPAETFNWLIDSSIRFNRFIIRQMSATLSQFIAMVEYERILDKSARVACLLASVFQYNVVAGRREKLNLNLTIPQEDLAMMCGVSRQTFNEILKELQQQGIVEIAYRSLRILDLDRLRKFGQR